MKLFDGERPNDERPRLVPRADDRKGRRLDTDQGDRLTTVERRRVTVALGFAGLLLAFLTVFSATGLAPMTDVQSLFYAYSALVGGNITLITVVVSLNQLLLSRELQTPGEVRSQIDNAIDYRSEGSLATTTER